ncbi:MAG: multidrug efflux RND transporter permease subunit [Parachlamydiales bacterium]|jgi:hydrophobe/amphiphile efflux-1 (HAE1) family protein
MISRFFIDRPIFAAVISIVIVLVGLVALYFLPIEQYPNITPPQIQVTASYNGADASTVADLVAAPLEEQINGVEDMIYMYSENSSNGLMSLNVYFNIGANADMAQVNVQNRVSQALPQLPAEVQKSGVIVQKTTPNILLIVAVDSPDDIYDDIFISNYATINVMDDLMRVKGVSNASNIGARDYSMRIWLRPDKLAELSLTASDVVRAVQEQNAQFGVGQIGQAPNANPVIMNIPISTKGRLKEPAEFENIILRAYEDGSMVQIKDVGRVELGAQDYSVDGRLNNKTTTLIAVYQEYGANAIDVADAIRKKMDELSQRFPEGLRYTIPYDTTEFIKMSIKEVSQTVFEAAFLVVLVVLIFLQKLRATLIPVLAMAVSLIGTFAGMYAFGFSLNTLTLFGLVLAVGIVVDDAIVVIENVERNMREYKLKPKEAARRAMDEVTGPIIAIVFVLCAVFIPVAFLGGIAGQLYRQFAVTIAISVVFSGIVALTLSPSVAALILKEEHKDTWFSRKFNSGFQKFTDFYMLGSAWFVRNAVAGIVFFCLLLALTGYLFQTIPTSFVPQEDQGYLMVVSMMPDGSSLDRTKEVDDTITQMSLKEAGVDYVVSFSGFSLIEGLNRTTIGSNFVVLKDWSQRTTPDLYASGILKTLQAKFAQIKESIVLVFNPPAIQGLGTVGGFEFWIENRGDGDISHLEQVTREFIAKANERPELQGLNTSLQADNMQLYINLDRYKTRSMGVAISEVFQTLQVLLGSLYINNFNKFGRTFQVVAQAEPKYRAKLSDIGEVYVKTDKGDMVPLNSLVEVEYRTGPTLVSRFNGFNAARILGNSAPGYTSGQAMLAMEEMAKEFLPLDMSYSWAGESYQEKATSGSSTTVLLGGMVMVFLILSALYERWALPVAIILAIPLGILGALIAIWIRGLSNDVYFQVGLVTLIALTAKNAILIVEFAVSRQEEGGLTSAEAAVDAARLRFRAILMTSLTFIFGVLPLVISKGAGAASRHSVGTGVMGGMISATIFVVLLVPLFYSLVNWRHKKVEKKEEPTVTPQVSEGV